MKTEKEKAGAQQVIKGDGNLLRVSGLKQPVKGFPEPDVLAKVQGGEQEKDGKCDRCQQNRVFHLQSEFAEPRFDVLQGVVETLFAFLDLLFLCSTPALHAAAACSIRRPISSN